MNVPNEADRKEVEFLALRRLASAPKRNLLRGLVLLLLLFIGPLLGATYWMNLQAERAFEREELLRDLVRARTLAALVEREFVSAQKILLSIVGRPSFRHAWAKGDLETIEAQFRQARELESDFLFVSVYERGGTLLAIYPPDPIVGQNFAYRDWYRGVTANWRPYVSEVYRTAAAANVLVVAVAVPIRDEQGNPSGILMAPYALNQLTRRFESLQEGASGLPYLVDQRGAVVAGLGIVPLLGEPLRAPEKDAVARALAGQEGSGRFGSGAQESFVGYAPLASLGWAVIYRRSAKDALETAADLRRRNFSMSLYLVLVYLVTAALAALLVRRQAQLLTANQTLNQALDDRVVELKQAKEAVARQSQDLAHSGQALWSQTKVLQSILESIGDGVVVADENGKFLVFNAAAEQMTGIGPTDGAPDQWSERYGVYSPDTVTPYPPNELPLTRAVRGESVDSAEVFVRNPKMPQGILLSVTGRPLRGEDGVLRGGVVVFRDITLQKRAEEALVRAKEEAERVSKFKDQFLSTMSHELRTPLNAILGFSELLPDQRYGTLNERQRRYISHIHTSGKHLLSLINDILDLSKIEAGRLELAFESVRVETAFGEVLGALRPLADKKSQTLSQHTETGSSVRADATRFKQVLMNLVGNSIKFTPEGGRIELAAHLMDGKVRVEVRDTGPGIPPEEQKRIFEAFYRLRQSGKATEGTGLGLAITQRLVELHGGQLGLESQPGQGSCFYFSLPIAPPVRERPVQETGSGPRTGEPPRILVIEDDPAAGQLIESQLASSGYEVVVCDQPQRALEMAAELQPNAITLDLLMTPINGWEVLVQLKRDPRTASIPVIVVTILDQRAMGTILGADEYVVKPVDKVALLAAIERCLTPRGGASPERPILVVEDDAPTREVITELLTAQGYAVANAADGAQARAWVAVSLPELVILDLLLPKVSGFELLAEWRASPRTADLPVFVLTSKDLSREEESYLRTHTESLFRKQQPWQEALVKQLQRVLNLGQLERA